MAYSWYESPVGRILLVGDEFGLSHLLFESGKHYSSHGIQPEWKPDADSLDDPPNTPTRVLFAECVRQLDEYFSGERQQFDLKLNLAGTPFQCRVWDELTRIQYGQTISYAQLADRIGQPGASRAVGSANGKNPVSIVVPCHRVIGSGGRLAGYSGGLSNKVGLLRLEGLQVRNPEVPERATVSRQRELMLTDSNSR